MLPCAAFATNLTLINWAQYMPPKVMNNYYHQTGDQVDQTYYSGSDMLKGMLLAGNTQYDLAVPALVDMQQEIHANLFYPLNKTLIPNLKHTNSALYKITAKIDKGNKYGVIYSYGTTGIGYNVKMVRKVLGPNIKINSWKILFEPKYLKKLQKCGIAFLNSPTQVFGITLHYLGLNPSSQNPADYARATKLLMKIRPYLTYFKNVTYEQDLANGNICIAMAYSGDILKSISTAKAAHDQQHLKYVIPQGGAPIWFDMLVIPKHAAHPKKAMAYINYLLKPKVMAQVSNYLGQPNAVPASKPYLIPVLQLPQYTPSEKTAKHLFVIKDPSLKLNQLISDYWFQVRYGVKISG